MLKRCNSKKFCSKKRFILGEKSPHYAIPKCSKLFKFAKLFVQKCDQIFFQIGEGRLPSHAFPSDHLTLACDFNFL